MVKIFKLQTTLTQHKSLGPSFKLEDLLKSNDEQEKERLTKLALISITNPDPRTRLAAITGLHWRYTPQIRQVYTIDELLRIEVRNSEDSKVPYYVGFIPKEYLTEETELYCWDLDNN